MLVMDMCVHVCIDMTESLSISEDKSLGSNRINSEFKVKIKALVSNCSLNFSVDVQVYEVLWSVREKAESVFELGESLPSLSYCSMH